MNVLHCCTEADCGRKFCQDLAPYHLGAAKEKKRSCRYTVIKDIWVMLSHVLKYGQ